MCWPGNGMLLGGRSLGAGLGGHRLGDPGLGSGRDGGGLDLARRGERGQGERVGLGGASALGGLGPSGGDGVGDGLVHRLLAFLHGLELLASAPGLGNDLLPVADDVERVHRASGLDRFRDQDEAVVARGQGLRVGLGHWGSHSLVMDRLCDQPYVDQPTVSVSLPKQ